MLAPKSQSKLILASPSSAKKNLIIDKIYFLSKNVTNIIFVQKYAEHIIYNISCITLTQIYTSCN